MTKLSIAELLNVLAKLDKLLDKHRIEYIVVGGLADYLLGVSTTEPGDIDILVSGENVEKLNAIIWQERNIVMLEPIRYREKGIIKGLYGRSLLDKIIIDILANVQLRYSGKWILFTYENLLPCTKEVRLTNVVTVRVPCPEIQVIADRALSRLDRAKAIENMVEMGSCGERVNNRLLMA